MCSRYELLTDFESIAAGEALRLPPSVDAAKKLRAFKGAEIRPTDIAPIVKPDGQWAMLPWGLAVSWQTQPVINARAETLDQKPTFQPYLSNRCLVPASAYFEWRAHGRAKIKTRIRADGMGVMMFAGLFGDGRFTIVTCAPSPAIAHIHDRMPVILGPSAQDQWLNVRLPFNAVKNILVPHAGHFVTEELSPPARQGELAL
ncbi:MAG: SOS response-associated peptidase [Rhodospirillaceae bacterium]|nr:SOS response-associated peptidase [Rhodospirillaceae bacterium]